MNPHAKNPLGFIKLTATAGLLALLGLWPQGAIAAETKFRVTTTWILNQVEPRPRSAMTRSVILITLHANKTVSEKTEWQVGNNYPTVERSHRSSKLGGLGGRLAPMQWKVVNEKTLVRLTAWPSHTFAIWLRVQGERSCTASLEWRLKSGYSIYEALSPTNGAKYKFTEPGWPHASCEVL